MLKIIVSILLLVSSITIAFASTLDDALASVNEEPKSFMSLDNYLKNDRDFVLAAIINDRGNGYKYIDESLKKDREILL